MKKKTTKTRLKKVAGIMALVLCLGFISPIFAIERGIDTPTTQIEKSIAPEADKELTNKEDATKELEKITPPPPAPMVATIVESEDVESEITPKEAEILDAMGVTPTEDTNKKTEDGRFVLGEVDENLIVLSSVPLPVLAADKEAKEAEIAPASTMARATRAAHPEIIGWDNGVYASVRFPNTTEPTKCPVISVAYVGGGGTNELMTYAYCSDPADDFPSAANPNGVPYQYDSAQLEKIKNIMYWGFNGSRPREDYVITWATIMCCLSMEHGIHLVEPSLIAKYYQNQWVRSLYAKRNTPPRNYNANWYIEATGGEVATYNPANNRQETGWYETREPGITHHGKFTINMPAGIKAEIRNINGVIYKKDVENSILIDDSDDFRFYANPNYVGGFQNQQVTNTEAFTYNPRPEYPTGAVRYIPKAPYTRQVQGLFVGFLSEKHITAKFSARFNGATGEVGLSKVDAQSGEALQGAVFELFKADNTKVGEYTTNVDGKISITGLGFGNYYFLEKTAPTGYNKITQKINFSLSTTAQKVTLSAPNYKNIPKFNFEFTKKDLKTDKSLKDADFALKTGVNTPTEAVFQRATSDNSGIVRFYNMIPGEYVLVEEKSPNGYILPAGYWTINIDESGQINITRNGNIPDFIKSDGKFTVSNTPYENLPITGGFGDFKTMGLILGSIVLLIAIGVGIRTKIKKKQERKGY